MKFTDIFIKRPVLASVISLLILAFGIRAVYYLPLRQFPKMENTVITVTTSYPGASAELMQGFITTPIEKAMTGADGINYITAESNQSISTIRAFIRLNYDPEQALTNILGKVAEARDELPKDSNEPIVKKETGDTLALMYISFTSNDMSSEQITDYLTKVVQPKLETLEGLSKASILGGSSFAMRIWLNPQKMAALKVTPSEVSAALARNNFQAAAGQTKGNFVLFNVRAQTDLSQARDFGNIVIKYQDGAFIRVKDVAQVKLGAEDYDSSVSFNGERAVFVGIFGTPSSNPLTVIDKVRKMMPRLERDSPPGLHGKIVYDGTKYIRSSIVEVITTIAEASAIVILVIFLFLGAIRTVTIPVITIPLSLIGVCGIMLAFNYSINLLTLLAMVLAIGLVVDDAIVVVENIYRHIEEGLSPSDAATKGAREIASPVIAMTITLAAVYAPIGLMHGLTGALFTEFAFTLAFAVIISGIVALTLSPMMCSKILNAELANQTLVKAIDRTFDKLRVIYQNKLRSTLNYQPVIILFSVVVLASCFFLYGSTQKELAPQEDKSVLFVSATAPEYANLDYLVKYTDQLNGIYRSIPETQDYFIINGMGSVTNAISGLILKPWDERNRSQAQVLPELQQKLSGIAGLKIAAFPLPPLPGEGGGLPIQFVLTSTLDHKALLEASQKIEQAAMKSGLFLFIDNSLKINKPQLNIKINRNKAAELGISMQDIGSALSTLLGGNYVNRFNIEGRSYQVIPQIIQEYRLNPERLKLIHLKTVDGSIIPLSTVVTLSTTVNPNKLEHFQQLNSATLQGLMMPGHTIAECLTFLQQKAEELLPAGVSYDYAGQSRQFIEEGNTMIYTFFFAILMIYLVLAAQFESFRDPLIILTTVPMSICGALILLNVGLSTLNIYTQIGLVTLIGLISKHGILMVEFANQLKEKGLTLREAIEQAAALRLRPILMTAFSMILGVVPLVIASGAGAASRYNLGLVVASGMLIGTFFTLFVVPTMYLLFSKKTSHQLS